MLSAAAETGGGSYFSLLMLVALFAAMYFMMIRPQQRRRREAERMQSSLSAGDSVVTIGGMHGTVSAIEGDVVALEVAPGVVVRYARPAVAQVVTPKSDPADEVVSTESGS